jgi:enoyl-CoA hydratase/carnithine racemase
LHYFDKECGDKVGCLILTGHGRAFAAGADIKEMKDQTYFEKCFKDATIEGLCNVASTKLPIIAAVHGFGTEYFNKPFIHSLHSALMHSLWHS